MNLFQLIDPKTKLGKAAISYSNVIRTAIAIVAWTFLAYFIGCVVFIFSKACWLLLSYVLRIMGG